VIERFRGLSTSSKLLVGAAVVLAFLAVVAVIAVIATGGFINPF
jgi:hypothetical protein